MVLSASFFNSTYTTFASNPTPIHPLDVTGHWFLVDDQTGVACHHVKIVDDNDDDDDGDNVLVDRGNK